MKMKREFLKWFITLLYNVLPKQVRVTFIIWLVLLNNNKSRSIDETAYVMFWKSLNGQVTRGMRSKFYALLNQSTTDRESLLRVFESK